MQANHEWIVVVLDITLLCGKGQNEDVLVSFGTKKSVLLNQTRKAKHFIA